MGVHGETQDSYAQCVSVLTQGQVKPPSEAHSRSLHGQIGPAPPMASSPFYDDEQITAMLSGLRLDQFRSMYQPRPRHAEGAASIVAAALPNPLPTRNSTITFVTRGVGFRQSMDP